MPFVRASAASQFTPSASIPAARTDTSTPKTNEASPFALLVDTATASPPKASEKASEQKAADSRSGKQPDSDARDQTATAQSSTQKTATQDTTAQPQIAGGDRQEENTQPAADQDAAPVSGLPQTIDQTIDQAIDQAIDPATLPVVAPASQITQAANDDAAPADDTISSEDAVALWPQSMRPGANQGAPQTAPAKTDKDVKKDVTDPGAQADDAALLATATSPAEQQPVEVAIAPPPPAAPIPALPVEAQADTAAPAIPPAAAAPQAPVLPQDPAAPQLAGQQPAANTDQPAAQAADPATGQSNDQTSGQTTNQDNGLPTGQSTGQPSDQTVSHIPLPAAALAAVPPVSTPDAALPAQSKVAADKTAQAPAPVNDQLQGVASQPGAPQPGVKGETSKPGKVSGETQQDSDPAIVKSADSASVQTDQVRQPDAQRPAASAVDTAFKAADNSIAPPATPSAAPQMSGASITQHIQVSAQPREAAPNMPALAVEIAGKSQSGAKQFDIRLDPPELGRVEVRLAIDATGKASAHLSADQPQTLTLLQKDAHILTRALRDAGLDVSQDGLNFSLRQQQDNGAGAQSNQSGGRSGRGFALAATTSLQATASSAAYSGSADGHLDIRV